MTLTCMAFFTVGSPHGFHLQRGWKAASIQLGEARILTRFHICVWLFTSALKVKGCRASESQAEVITFLTGYAAVALIGEL